jgi:hypothetical protein
MLPEIEPLTILQIARLLNTSTSTARRRFNDHPQRVDTGPGNKRAHLRIPREAVLKFISERTGQSVVQAGKPSLGKSKR